MHSYALVLTAAAALLTGAAAEAALRGSAPEVALQGRRMGSCSGTDYDYLALVQQWAPTVCDGNYNCDNVQDQHFTLHGLWPNDFNGDYPCNCGSQTFNLSAVTSLLPELHEYWPSYKCADDDNCNSGFWGHEWTKHGTCMVGGSGVSDEFDFFDVTLKLRNKYDVLVALSAAGIVPDNDKALRLDDVSKAYKAYYNVYPAPQCSGSKISGWESCFDKNLTPIDCPSALGSCSSYKDLYLPATTH